MKLISLNITEKQEEWIQLFVDLGYSPDRSACIRDFINYGIKYLADLNVKKSILYTDIDFEKDIKKRKKELEENENVF